MTQILKFGQCVSFNCSSWRNLMQFVLITLAVFGNTSAIFCVKISHIHKKEEEKEIPYLIMCWPGTGQLNVTEQINNQF